MEKVGSIVIERHRKTTLEKLRGLVIPKAAAPCGSLDQAPARATESESSIIARLTLATMLAVTFAAPSAASVDPSDLCKDKKGKEVGKYTLNLLKTFGKNGKVQNIAKLGDDVSKAQSKLVKGFTKAEFSSSGTPKGCLSTGDVADLEAGTQDFVDAVIDNLCDPAATGVVCPRFPATGQTTCWDSGGIVVACGGTGHDGDVRAGAPLAYTDNGDGTISDLNTGLMWEKKDDDNTGGLHDRDDTYTWDDTFSIFIDELNNRCNDDETEDCTVGGDATCAALFGPGAKCGFAGYRDWRVPNVKELQSIVDYERFSLSIDPVFNSGCVPDCTVLTCSCTTSSDYWSSTSRASSPTFAWGVSFSGGDVDFNPKGGNSFVRAVRGGL